MVDESIHYLPCFFSVLAAGNPAKQPGTVRRDTRRWQDMTSQRLRQVLHLLMVPKYGESSPPGDVQNPMKNGIFTISTGDFFL